MMFDFNSFSKELHAARPLYRAINPGYANLVRGRAASAIRTAGLAFGAIQVKRSGAPMSEVTGSVVGSLVVRRIRRPIKNRIVKVHRDIPDIPKRDPFRKNGMGGRSWYTTPRHEEMVIVFHDANRVGPHVDVHIGRLSLVYNLRNKDIYEKLRYNRDGMLTEDSKKLLIDHVRAEIANGSRVPQNLDHSLANARAGWTGGDPEARHYGSGRTRQIVDISTVDIYKAHRDGPIEMYAPRLNPYRSLYLYKLYSGDEKRAPILIWGAKSSNPPVLDDRLHLKMMDPGDMERVAKRVDMTTATAKYDGSSCYIVITPKGTTVWSPRHSAVTGERIEYTQKLDGIANLHSDKTIIAMGELLFRHKTRFGWQKQGFYLPSATGSGILNSNSVLPRDVEPEIRLYRVDRIGREKTGNLDFWENRELQEQVAAMMPSHLKVVELMEPDVAMSSGFEGIVAVPPGLSVNDGVKVKWWTDPNDWEIRSIEFRPGERGGMAGVIRAVSLDSGKEFKLGPGQVGDRKLTEHMMNNPDAYVGAVLKVNSRHGHEGRAAKVVAIHDDKGIAVLTEDQ